MDWAEKHQRNVSVVAVREALLVIRQAVGITVFVVYGAMRTKRVFRLTCPYNRRWWVDDPWEKRSGAWWQLCCTSTEAGVPGGCVSGILFRFKTREGLECDSAHFPLGWIWVPSCRLHWHLWLKRELEHLYWWGSKICSAQQCFPVTAATGWSMCLVQVHGSILGCVQSRGLFNQKQ